MWHAHEPVGHIVNQEGIENEADLYRYQAFGLIISSEIELSGLGTVSATTAVDLTIRRGLLPDVPEQTEYRQSQLFAGANWIQLGPVEIGCLRITEGRSMTVDPKGATDDLVQSLIINAGIFTALMQRGTLVMHAAVVAVDDGAILIAGEREAGKSTSAAEFLRAGYPLLSDDHGVISYRDKQALVWPGYRVRKLHRDGIERHGLESQASPIANERGKYRVIMSDGLAPAPLPPRAIFILRKESTPELKITEVKGARKLVLLNEQRFRRRLSTVIKTYQTPMMTFASQVRVFELIRPNEIDTREQLVPAILQALQQDP